MLDVFARLVSIAVPTNAIITDIIRIAIGMTAISVDPLWRSLRLVWSRPVYMRQVICPPFPDSSLMGGAKCTFLYAHLRRARIEDLGE